MGAACGKGLEIARVGPNNDSRLAAKLEYLSGIGGEFRILADHNRVLLRFDDLRRDHILQDRIENCTERRYRTEAEQIVEKSPATGILWCICVHKINISVCQAKKMNRADSR